MERPTRQRRTMGGRGARARRRGAGARVALALTAALAVAACSQLVRSPTVRIADVRVASVGLLGGTADVTLQVENRNSFALTAEEIGYRLSFAEADGDWRVLTEGTSEQRIRIEGADSARVQLQVPFEYEDLGRALGSLLSSGELAYLLEGEVEFDTPVTNVRVPFERQGSFTP